MAPLLRRTTAAALVALALCTFVPTTSSAADATASMPACTDAKLTTEFAPVKALMDTCTAATTLSLLTTELDRTDKDKLCAPCSALLTRVNDPLGIPTCTLVDANGVTRRLRNLLQIQFKRCPTYNISASDDSGSSDTSSRTTATTTSPKPRASTAPTLKSAANGTTNSSADAQTSSTDSSMGVGVLIGIISTAVVLLALVAAALVVWRRRRSYHHSTTTNSRLRRGDSDKFDVSVLGGHDDDLNGNVPTAPFQMSFTSSSRGDTSGSAWNPASSLGPAPASGNMWEDDVIAAARIPKDKVVITSLLSRGGFGEIYRGLYNHKAVAIKSLLPETRNDMIEINALLFEGKLMASLTHERIVTFIGVAWDALSDVCVLSEYMEGGDLRGLVVQFEDVEHRCHGFDADKIKIALHVAHALTFLHSLRPAMLHRDLKSKNILLDSQLNAKLTDFGVSRETSDRTMTAGVGTSLWMAPEIMLGGRYNDKADVFSFGIVLSELDTHAVPYRHVKAAAGSSHRIPDSAILQMVSRGELVVQFSSDALPEMVALGHKCVSVNPKDRPSAADVFYTLHGILNSRYFLGRE